MLRRRLRGNLVMLMHLFALFVGRNDRKSSRKVSIEVAHLHGVGSGLLRPTSFNGHGENLCVRHCHLNGGRVRDLLRCLRRGRSVPTSRGVDRAGILGSEAKELFFGRFLLGLLLLLRVTPSRTFGTRENTDMSDLQKEQPLHKLQL